MELFHFKKKKRTNIAKRKKREREKERRKTLNKVGILISSSSSDATSWPAGIRLDRSPGISKRFNAYEFDYDRSLTYFVLPLKTQRPLAEPWTIYDFERVMFVSFDTERRGKKIWTGSLWWTTYIWEIQRSQLSFWIIQILIFHQKLIK